MTGGKGTNIPASIKARLLKVANEKQIDFQLLLNRYVIERFLYRLSQSPEREGFVLKGAMLLALWTPGEYRMTKDLDLLGRVSVGVDVMVHRIAGICRTAVETDDGVDFQADDITGEQIRAEDEYAGVRLRVPAILGKARARIQIDVGIGDAAPGIREAVYPTYLDLPAPFLLVYSREAAIAEKFEAMVALGATNSRQKDYFDIFTLARNFAFKGAALRQAIEETFSRRGRPVPSEPPIALTTQWAGTRMQETNWRAFLRRTAARRPTAAFADVVDAVAAFVIPPARAAAQGRPFDNHWPAGGPWTPRT